MLIECDRQGQVIWLSERTRSIVGTPASLAEVLDSWSAHPGIPLRLYCLLRAPDGLLLAAEADLPAASEGMQHAAALHQLEQKMLAAYHRLLLIERRLSQQAARRKPGAGKMAIRQIELERRRIAGDLHTGVGQMLAAIRLQLEIITSQLSDPPEAVRLALANVSALASGALEQVRSVSRRLHPPDWQRLTIEAALRQLWEVSGIPLGFDAHLDVAPLRGEPELEVKALIYRAAQEGLSNIISHSGAQTVAMSLKSQGDMLVLTLQDDGVGFSTTAAAGAGSKPPEGIGLRSLAEQAVAIGAKIDTESGPTGSRLTLIAQYRVES
jgi:signal transduction histidine kinase